jgi:hypothetical protein
MDAESLKDSSFWQLKRRQLFAFLAHKRLGAFGFLVFVLFQATMKVEVEGGGGFIFRRKSESLFWVRELFSTTIRGAL